MKNKVRPIDANALAKRIREYMDNFPYAGTRLATCRVVLSMLGDEGQTPTLTDHFPDLTNMIPLTLEQLREMDGQPVWAKVIGKTGIRCDGWCEVEIREKDPFAYVWWPGSEVEDIAKIEDYGKTWVCYAYPPAHIDRGAWTAEWRELHGDKMVGPDDCGDDVYRHYHLDYVDQIKQAKHAAVKWREKHQIVGVGELRVDCMVDDLTRSITDLLARAEAAEDRVRELETSFRTEKCENGPECAELGRARKRAEAAEARAEKSERERDAAISDLTYIARTYPVDLCDDLVCQYCKHYQNVNIGCPGWTENDCFEWRGKKEE